MVNSPDKEPQYIDPRKRDEANSPRRIAIGAGICLLTLVAGVRVVELFENRESSPGPSDQSDQSCQFDPNTPETFGCDE